MLTKHNTVNWIRFMDVVLDDKSIHKKIQKFLYPYRGETTENKSRYIYNKYCK